MISLNIIQNVVNVVSCSECESQSLDNEQRHILLNCEIKMSNLSAMGSGSWIGSSSNYIEIEITLKYIIKVGQVKLF
jgi:hypothetical protein